MNKEAIGQSRQFGPLLLVFRWLSLSPVLWFFLSPAQPAVPARQTLWIAAFIGGGTLIITLFQRRLLTLVQRYPWLLVFDLLVAVGVLTASGADTSLFALYAFNPLLAGAIFLSARQLMAMSGLFTVAYLLAILVANDLMGLTVNLSRVYAQFVSAWLMPWLLYYPVSQLRHIQAAWAAECRRAADLLDENQTLTADYDQLEVVHELTSFLQGASTAQDVQERLLTAITAELGFTRAVMALVNRDIMRLEDWRSAPETQRHTLFSEPMAIVPENGLLSQLILDRQSQWVTPRHPLTNNRNLNDWLGHEYWLVMPVEYQANPVAILLVSGPATQTFDAGDRVWATLASVVSQAGLTLGTLFTIQNLAREKERNRIAREIHDSVAQSLFGIVFTLDACIKLLPAHVDDVQQELLTLRTVVEQVRQDVRESIIEHWSTSMTDRDFRTGLRRYLASLSSDAVFHIEFNIAGDFDGLPVHIQQALFRVSQEALANAARHAGVDSARLILYVEPDEVFLSIRDTGTGFVPGQVMAGQTVADHFGLRGIQERVQTIGGLCDVLSQPNQGTQILVRVPLQGEHHHD